ncbi:sulfate ABC transporter substrate-binding protein [Mycolicibacterium cyprinidarum]|nr:sulfate ABC transporter substrate-binding protein [Mycolicibacterium sp. NGTWS1803]
MKLQFATRSCRVAAITVVAVVLGASAACSQDTAADADQTVNDRVVRVASFSSAQTGWDATIPDFTSSNAARLAAGNSATREVKVEYGASGEVVEKILDGRPADIAYVTDADDIADLVKGEAIPANWDNGTIGGLPVNSVVTMVVRAGNPRGIHDWPDLLQPGLEVITPNPVNVGSGRWALLAGYAAASSGDHDPEAGKNYLRRLILEHIALGPTTVKQATDEFVGGRGDVLLLSEASATQLVRKGFAVEQVLPPQTMRMDFAIAITKSGLEKPLASELIQFMFSPRGQQSWAQAGFRPGSPVPEPHFPVPQHLWTITDLGGWESVGRRYFGAHGFITNLFKMATQ